jgi:hypothetical protein
MDRLESPADLDRQWFVMDWSWICHDKVDGVRVLSVDSTHSKRQVVEFSFMRLLRSRASQEMSFVGGLGWLMWLNVWFSSGGLLRCFREGEFCRWLTSFVDGLRVLSMD